MKTFTNSVLSWPYVTSAFHKTNVNFQLNMTNLHFNYYTPNVGFLEISCFQAALKVSVDLPWWNMMLYEITKHIKISYLNMKSMYSRDTKYLSCLSCDTLLQGVWFLTFSDLKRLLTAKKTTYSFRYTINYYGKYKDFLLFLSWDIAFQS